MLGKGIRDGRRVKADVIRLACMGDADSMRAILLRYRGYAWSCFRTYFRMYLWDVAYPSMMEDLAQEIVKRLVEIIITKFEAP